MSAPLTAVDARALLREAFTPGPPCWGLEVEWLIYPRDDSTARPGQRVLGAFAGLALPAGGRVTLEPGGQVELSTAPRRSLDEALDALALDAAELARLLGDAGLVAVDRPVDLERLPLRLLDLPRYRAMESFFDAGGPAGRWMMCNTASVQLNVSHDVQDPAARWRLCNRLAPILVAVFANSPGRDLSGHAWASLRQGIWHALDPTRTSPLRSSVPAVDAWTRYVLDADVMLVRDHDDARPCEPGTPFGRWLDGGIPGRSPNAEDLRYHTTTLFPPVRPRGWLEIRVLDALPAHVREVAALVVAACLEPAAAARLLAELPDEAETWPNAARRGLDDPAVAQCADLVFDTAIDHVAAVTGRPDRRRSVIDYATAVVAERRQPWGGRVSDDQPRTLVDLSRRDASPAFA